MFAAAEVIDLITRIFIFLALILVCAIGIYQCEKRSSAYKKRGYKTEAAVLSKSVCKFPSSSERGRDMTWYHFDVEYINKQGLPEQGRLSTARWRGKKISEHDTIKIFVIDGELLIKEDMPGLAQKLFLEIFAILCITYLVLSIMSMF